MKSHHSVFKRGPRRRGPFQAAALSLLVTLAMPFVAASGADVEAERALLKREVEAVIGIEMVVTVKVKMGDREMPPRERRVEVNGTVLTAKGLTVASLAQVDPEAEIDAAQALQPGRQIELLGTDFKEVKLRRADGTEVPARFVMKDADLDLAFFAPVAGGATEREFAHVDLANDVDGAVMDRFYVVTRAPKSLQRVPMMRTTEVMGIIERPRKFYLMTEVSLGSPTFDAAGKLLGVSLQHFANGRRTGVVVLPAEDIAEIAKQAEAAAEKAGSEAPSEEAAMAGEAGEQPGL